MRQGYFRCRRRGASLTGYGLIVGLIAIAAILAVGNVGEQVRQLFAGVADQLAVSVGGSGTGGGGSGGDDEEEEEEDPPPEEVKAIADDAATGDLFGWSVSAEFPWVLVGAMREGKSPSVAGAAYLFNCMGEGCTQTSKMTASDGAANDAFGVRTAFSGGRALIGARGLSSSRGAAYLYDCTGGNCEDEIKITASDPVNGDNFGYAVALDGNWALAGAPAKASFTGAAYLYDCTGSSCTQEDKIVSSDGFAGQSFADNLSISGNRILVSALHDNHAGFQSGAAYLYDCAGGTCTDEHKITASDAAPGDWFGSATSLSGNKALIGARLFGSDSSRGVAYLYDCTGGTCGDEIKIIPSDGATGDNFGGAAGSVSFASGFALIGARGHNGNRGAAYLYDCSGGSCVGEVKFTASDAASGDLLGQSVVLSGGRAITGAYAAQAESISGAGAVYLFATP